MTTSIAPSAYHSNLTDAELESWRHVQDNDADAVADMLINSDHWHDVYIALSKIKYNNDLVDIDIFKAPGDTDTDTEHKELVQKLNNYFNDVSELTFNEAEKQIIQQGCRFFCLHANDAIFILAVRSLLKQYAAFKATNVLVNTKLLVKFPHRRILETFQFVIDVMDVNGLMPKGRAIRSLQKLRLVHAMIRARFKRQETDSAYKDATIREKWDASWGLPINQQDMIFALHTFSIEIIDGLKAKGEKLTVAEIENFYLTWHYYGRALGIHDALNPSNYTEGKALQKRIYKNQFILNNPNATVLAIPLIEFLRKLLPLHDDRHLYSIVKVYNDKRDYKHVFQKILKLPIEKATWMFVLVMKYSGSLWEWVMKIIFKLASDKQQESFKRAIETKNFDILQKLVNLEGNWSSKSFEIPDGFGDARSIEDEEVLQKEPNIFVRCLQKIFPGFWKLKNV